MGAAGFGNLPANTLRSAVVAKLTDEGNNPADIARLLYRRPRSTTMILSYRMTDGGKNAADAGAAGVSEPPADV
jgi:hypothetical protein